MKIREPRTYTSLLFHVNLALSKIFNLQAFVEPASVEPGPILFESTPRVESPRSTELMKDEGNQDNIQPLHVYSRNFDFWNDVYS